MNNIGHRMRSKRNELNMTLEEVAKVVGITRQTIQRYESGVISNIPSDRIELIAKALNTTPSYLMGWGDSPQSSISFSFDDFDFDDYGPVASSPAVRIPVLGKVAAGIPIAAIEDIIDYEEIPAEMAKTGEFFGLKIEGQSMEPRVMDGDVVIVRKQEEVESGEIAIVMVDGNDATCKKFVKHESGVSLVSFNPAFSPQFYTAEECEKLPVRIIGKVVELRGKF